MITASNLKFLTTLNASALNELLHKSGYKFVRNLSSEFVGMTNGAEFCYRASFLEDKESKTAKIFVHYDSVSNKCTASY